MKELECQERNQRCGLGDYFCHFQPVNCLPPVSSDTPKRGTRCIVGVLASRTPTEAVSYREVGAGVHGGVALGKWAVGIS